MARLLSRVATLTAVVALLAPFASAAQEPAEQAEVRAALAALSASSRSPLRLSLSPETGAATFVGTQANGAIPLGLPSSASARGRAQTFLERHGAALGVRDVGDLVLVRQLAADAAGVERVRYRQTVGGIPVTGGELSVHLRGDAVVAAHAKLLRRESALGLDLRPSLDASAAAARARTLLGRLGLGDAVLAAKLSAGELQVFDRGLLGGRAGTSRLAWFFEATGLSLREYVWVDAASGAILLHFSQLGEARNREVYDAEDDDVLPGTLLRDEDDPATGDPDADLAHDFLGDTYDYFFDEHGRDSYDGAGATLVASVHFCPTPIGPPCLAPYENAFWNGSQMVFGEGYSAADDVVAHELTHAVVDATAGLFGYMQSGALNESYADIFGETTDLGNAAGDDTSGVRWLIGEDLPDDEIRDMSDPNAFSDPAKMSDEAFFGCGNPEPDDGGEHINTGVPNHAYALMVDGGTFNGETVTGIGLTKAGAIQYRALTTYLLSASDFLDNYNAVQQSCQDLIGGAAGITAGDCAEVKQALDAVEMYFPWPCNKPRPTEQPLCPSGGLPTTLFSTDFENETSGDWALEVIDGGGDIHWDEGIGDDDLYWSLFATSGTQHLWGNNHDLEGDSAVEMTFDVAVPAGGARMQFHHSYGFETDDLFDLFTDGGVLEYSTNGGGAWLDAGSLVAEGEAYGGELYSGNPLGAVSAFVSDSHGYTTTQLDLAPLAGQNVRLRFRMATDEPFPPFSTEDFGWFIDDVRFYTCGGEVVLIDQTAFPSDDGVSSQKFEASLSDADTFAAADFSPALPIAVRGVVVPGFYDNGGTDGAVPRLNVSIHEDSGGLPGDAICSYDGLRAGIEFSDTAGTFQVQLPASCCVPSGTHWLMVQADMDFATGGQWLWRERTTVSGNPFAWQNPGDFFETGCTTWGTQGACIPDADPDLLFSLWQGEGPAVPPTLLLENETVTTTELHEAGTITAQEYELESTAQVTLRAATSVTLRDGFRVESGALLRVAIIQSAGCP